MWYSTLDLPSGYLQVEVQTRKKLPVPVGAGAFWPLQRTRNLPAPDAEVFGEAVEQFSADLFRH